MAQRDWIGVALVMWLLGVVSACDTPPGPIDPALAQKLAQIRYPKDAPADDLDIVVVRSGRELVLTNRTATAYDNAHLWLNQQYVGVVGHVPIGTPVRCSLGGFVNRYGQTYPVGGPFTPDKTLPVVLAELSVMPGGPTVLRDDAAVGRGLTRFRLLVRQDGAN